MTPEEAQQAQTIADIRNRDKEWLLSVGIRASHIKAFARQDIKALLEIVDSQAQKIAELSALFQKAGNGAVDLAMKCAEQELKIAEQAKEIKRLKSGGLIKPGSYRRLIRNLRNAKP